MALLHAPESRHISFPGLIGPNDPPGLQGLFGDGGFKGVKDKIRDIESLEWVDWKAGMESCDMKVEEEGQRLRGTWWQCRATNSLRQKDEF